MNNVSDLMDPSLDTHPAALRERDPARARLFYVIWIGAMARVTHDVQEVRDVLRWRDERSRSPCDGQYRKEVVHGGRVFVMNKMSDCASLLTTAPPPVQQSVRQFLNALTHGQGVYEAERQSHVLYPGEASAQDAIAGGHLPHTDGRSNPKP